MRISLGDVSLWFDVSGPSVVPHGDTTVERPVLVAVHGGPGLDHLTVKSALGPLAEDFQVLSAPEVEDLRVAGLVERIADRVGGRPVYVSVDIDVLDPAHAPGTGTPEAGGLTSRELLAALRSFARLNLVGADIVEVAPAYDLSLIHI